MYSPAGLDLAGLAVSEGRGVASEEWEPAYDGNDVLEVEDPDEPAELDELPADFEEQFVAKAGLPLKEASVVIRRACRAELRGDIHLADDAAQLTVLAILKRAAKPESADPSHWLAVVARNRTRDLVRSRVRSRRRDELVQLADAASLREADDSRGVDELAVANVWSRNMSRTIDAAIDALPSENDRTILRLSLDRVHGTFQALSERQLAEKLGIPPGTVKSRKNTAMRSLRVQLRAMGARPEGDHND